MIKNKMDEAEMLALPVTVDLPTAARAFGLGRTKAFELAHADKFPCPVLRLGKRLVVTKAALLRALGLPVPGEQSGNSADAAA